MFTAKTTLAVTVTRADRPLLFALGSTRSTKPSHQAKPVESLLHGSGLSRASAVRCGARQSGDGQTRPPQVTYPPAAEGKGKLRRFILVSQSDTIRSYLNSAVCFGSAAVPTGPGSSSPPRSPTGSRSSPHHDRARSKAALR